MTESTTPVSDTGGSTPETRRKRKIAITFLTSLFSIIGLCWLIYWLIWGQFEVYTDDAYVNGNVVQLMAQVSGTVVAINTDDTYLVHKGQTLIKLDSADKEIALRRSTAALAQTVREVHQAFEKVGEVQSLLLLRTADLQKAKLDLKRRAGLLSERAISREELQHVQTMFESAKAQYNYTLHNLSAAQAIVANTHLYTHPLVERAKANVRKAYLDFVRTIVVAPLTGYVAKRNVQVGQQVTMATPLLAIVPLNAVWIEANYKESQLNNLRIGQPVTIYADAYSDFSYHGKVVGLNAGTGAAFSLLPPQNATGNWIKIVQRLPVRISLDPEELSKQPLQIGLSLRVTTHVHDMSGLRLAEKSVEKSFYSTDVYANQLKEANKLIEKILMENSSDLFLRTTHG